MKINHQKSSKTLIWWHLATCCDMSSSKWLRNEVIVLLTEYCWTSIDSYRMIQTSLVYGWTNYRALILISNTAYRWVKMSRSAAKDTQVVEYSPAEYMWSCIKLHVEDCSQECMAIMAIYCTKWEHMMGDQFLPHDVILASCAWGPATAHGVGMLTALYVIYMERQFASCCRALLRPGTFFKFDTFPATLATCQNGRSF